VTQAVDKRHTAVQEESPALSALQDEAQIQYSDQNEPPIQSQQQEEPRAIEEAENVREEQVRPRVQQVFTELDDDAYVDFEHDAVAQDADTARLQELATKEARQLAADQIHALASHRYHNYSNTSTGEEAYIRYRPTGEVSLTAGCLALRDRSRQTVLKITE